MSKKFTRILRFKVEGEIYVAGITPENIIRNYSWSCRNDTNGKVFLVGCHNDTNGTINNMTLIPKISLPEIPDTEYFVV